MHISRDTKCHFSALFWQTRFPVYICLFPKFCGVFFERGLERSKHVIGRLEAQKTVCKFSDKCGTLHRHLCRSLTKKKYVALLSLYLAKKRHFHFSGCSHKKMCTKKTPKTGMTCQRATRGRQYRIFAILGGFVHIWRISRPSGTLWCPPDLSPHQKHV